MTDSIYKNFHNFANELSNFGDWINLQMSTYGDRRENVSGGAFKISFSMCCETMS